MIRTLLLSILIYESVAAQGALDEGHEHPWSRALDECMAAGGQRSDCWESMPPDILAELEAWEAERGVIRRRQFQSRPQLVNQRTMMFIVYESRVELDDAVSDEIDGIVNSLTVSVLLDCDKQNLTSKLAESCCAQEALNAE
jgi:hypothetical protein